MKTTGADVGVEVRISYIENVKALLTIVVILLYAVSAAGVQFYVHTCGGETTVDPLPISGRDPCGCDDGMDQERCCTSQLLSADLDDAQPVLKVTVAGTPVAFLTSSLAPVQGPAPTDIPFLLRSTANAPPSRVSPTILFCTFLI